MSSFKILPLTLILILCLNGQKVFGQFQQGTLLLGGLSHVNFNQEIPNYMDFGYTRMYSVNENGEKSDIDTDLSINVIPRLGYFIIDNLAAGFDLYLGYYRSTMAIIDYINNSVLIGIGPFIRYYIPLEKVSPFIEGSYSINAYRDKSESTLHSETGKANLHQFVIGAGLGIPISERISFDSQLGYSHQILIDPEDSTGEKGVLNTIGVKFGFTIFLNRDLGNGTNH